MSPVSWSGSSRVRARDDVVAMFCRRNSAIHKRGRLDLGEIRERHRAETERLWDVFGQVLAAALEALGEGETDDQPEEPGLIEDAGSGPSATDPRFDGWVEIGREVHERAGGLMLAPLAEAGGVTRVYSEHAALSAHHGNNYLPLLERHYRSHRSVLLDLIAQLDFVATSADDSVLSALDFLKAVGPPAH